MKNKENKDFQQINSFNFKYENGLKNKPVVEPDFKIFNKNKEKSEIIELRIYFKNEEINIFENFKNLNLIINNMELFLEDIGAYIYLGKFTQDFLNEIINHKVRFHIFNKNQHISGFSY